MSGGSGSFLEIQPSELALPFEIMKQSSCSMQLTNKTDHYVAFKVKTTNPKQYCVRPNIGVVSPGSTCDVTVTMQAQKESPPDMQCKDKFLVQSVAAENGVAAQDINAAMFNKEPGKVVDEFKLRVVYVPTTTPSPIPEDSDLGSSSYPFAHENGINNSAMPQSVQTGPPRPRAPPRPPTAPPRPRARRWSPLPRARARRRLLLDLAPAAGLPSPELALAAESSPPDGSSPRLHPRLGAGCSSPLIRKQLETLWRRHCSMIIDKAFFLLQDPLLVGVGPDVEEVEQRRLLRLYQDFGEEILEQALQHRSAGQPIAWRELPDGQMTRLGYDFQTCVCMFVLSS